MIDIMTVSLTTELIKNMQKVLTKDKINEIKSKLPEESSSISEKANSFMGTVNF